MKSSDGSVNRYVEPLELAGTDDTARVGRKAAFLGEMLRAGLPVPPGRVVTTDAQLRVAEAGTDYPTVPLPADVAGALDELAAELGDADVAVRSSGVKEDLAGSSFAGQYETVLNVRGRAALEDALRTCWASASSAHVREYQRAHGADGESAMAVVVQQMVPAVAAGVAFSANPLTGRRDEVVVNAVRGLGERLVSGQASPDEWVVADGAPERKSGREDALEADRIAEVAELARTAERHFGQPQDIEWAFDGERIWLVQARPITTLPDEPEAVSPIPVEVPPGRWTRDTFSTRPWKPLQVSEFQPVLNRSTRGMADYGMANGLEYRQIGGWPYSQLIELAPDEFGPRLDAVAAAVERDDHGATIERWYSEWRAEFTGRIGEFRRFDLAGADDAALVGQLGVVRELVDDLFTVHFRIGSAGLYLMGEFGLFCRDELGWDLPRSLEAVIGLPGMTTEPAFALAEIASWVRSKPELAERLAALEVSAALDVPAALAGLDPELAKQWAAYVDRYCHRVMGVDISEPTLAEQQWTVLRLLVDQVTGGYDAQVAAESSAETRRGVVDEALALLRDKNPGAIGRFEHLLARAERAQPSRDDKAFLIATTRGLFRYTVREFGARLAARGLLSDPDEVFFLEVEELVPALRDGAVPAREVLGERRARYTWAVRNRGPLRYGPDPAPSPDSDEPPAWLQHLPEQVRHPMTVLMWIYGRGNATAATSATGDLAGVAGSPGEYTGPVRVILGEDQFDELREGEVLVCPETTPQWSLLFPKVGALITDTGGLLSHPAIIAREYRIPAVIATGDGTEVLRTGQIVTVNGDAGTVEILR